MPDARRTRLAAFLDRDGVINEELNYVHRIEDFHLVPGAVEGLRSLQSQGFLLIVVTNQAGIAKAKYDEAQYETLTRHMRSLLAEQGIELAAVYHCPHHPEGRVRHLAIDCDCRKPKPGMLLKAAERFIVDLPNSVLVGDKLSDIEAAKAAGVGTTILVRSGHALPPDVDQHVDQCFPDLLAASQWLQRRGQ